jgi:hypothetical protein
MLAGWVFATLRIDFELQLNDITESLHSPA